ncbi:MAG: PhoH family protein [Alphaproteobacteria bacterium]
MSKILEFSDTTTLPALYGAHNAHLRHLEGVFGVEITSKSNQLILSGNKGDISACEVILRALEARVTNGDEVGIADIDAEVRFMKDKDAKGSGKKTSIKTKKKTIEARSPNQNTYLNLIKDKEMVFGLGPAGTGKTYLAVAMGVSMFLNGDVERLIFTRPAVEAGENLGFLPGDLKEKVDPYLRPIYDAMQDMMPWDFVVKKMEAGEIEVAPLAFMRGRTLSNAFVILDEAQNTTATQMKMFLTRMGEASRMVITGDISQTDLPRGVKSGLRDAYETLNGIDDIGFMQFKTADVVRHKLVGKIIQAYDARKPSH